MIRYYLSDVQSAPFLGFHPVLHGLVPTVRWSAVDGRANPTLAAGKMLVRADVTQAQHNTLVADARITFLPFLRADGTDVPLSAPLSDVSLANRNTLTSIADSFNVPIQGLGGGTVGQALRRFMRRFLIRQILRANDFTEGLDTLVSAIPLAKRQAIASALQARGFDTSVIVGSDTVREAIRKLLEQNIRFFGRT